MYIIRFFACLCRYLEIYNESIYDLLAAKDRRGKKLRACEGDSRSKGAVNVMNLSTFEVNNTEVCFPSILLRTFLG